MLIPKEPALLVAQYCAATEAPHLRFAEYQVGNLLHKVVFPNGERTIQSQPPAQEMFPDREISCAYGREFLHLKC